MRRLIYISIITISMTQYGFTQIKWVKSIGGEGSEWPLNILVDDSKDIYLSANFENSIDVDPSLGEEILNATLASETFVLKIDSSGNFIKVDHLIDERIGSSISIDNENNVYYIYSIDGWSEFKLEKRNQQGIITNQIILSGVGSSDFQLPRKLSSVLTPIPNTYCLEFNRDIVSLQDQDFNCLGDNYSLTNPDWKGYLAFGASNYSNGVYQFACEVNGTVNLKWGDNNIEIGESDAFNDTFWKTSSYILDMDVNGNLLEVKKVNEGGMQDPTEFNQNLVWNLETDSDGNMYLHNLLWGTYTYGVGENEKIISSMGGPGVSNSILQKVNHTTGEHISLFLGAEANFTDLMIDNNNDIILSGIYQSSVDLDLSENSSVLLNNLNSVNNSFIVKYNSELEYIEHFEFKDVEIFRINDRNESIYFFGRFHTDTLVIGNEPLINNGNADLIVGEFIFNLTSSDNDMIIEEISISPNPFQEHLQVKSSSQIEDIEIYDIYGRKQYFRFDNSTYSLDTKYLKNGLYFLVINTKTSIINKTILKNGN